ncbi:uncharacterized protein LOC116027844 [Ipomoea triloba]|uniref:uncharacterized protein LOC116027844 n=1 Tax=Ipomoea triloba TaxID=35885 RepID=UPI00125E886A|nr:uncharacterized protein LOC116027844 [Ipomoea triloba]XP_031125464.1 uncharacterized protein LOC116027844 [Ipomoea triloba]
MNSLFQACSAAIVSKTSCVVGSHSICRFSVLPWKVSFSQAGIRRVYLNSFLERVYVRSYSSKKSSRNCSWSQKSDHDMASTPALITEDDEINAFFVVRKGDLVGIYRRLSDCQSQVGSSICDPPVSVYKGYAMPKDTEDYLISRGLKNALYTIRAQDLTEDLFGSLLLCPFQDVVGSTVLPDDSLRKHAKLEHDSDQVLSLGRSCTLEFDGASKGTGQAGAGAVVRADDGSLTCRLREGLGIATCNAAEYRGIILGLKYALSKGFTSIRVQGDSKLVCMQIQGHWKVKSQNLSVLCGQAKQLKDRFLSFEIIHVLRKFNSDADVQANLGAALPDGQIQEEIVLER